MHRRLMSGTLALGATVLLLAWSAGEAAAQGAWLQNYQQAKAEARKTGKPMFLVFR